MKFGGNKAKKMDVSLHLAVNGTTEMINSKKIWLIRNKLITLQPEKVIIYNQIITILWQK